MYRYKCYFHCCSFYDTGIQWQKLIAAVWTPIGGATSDSYTINPVALGDAGDYRVVYTNSAGTATSNVVTLTVNPAAVGGTVSSSATVCSGSNSGTLTLPEKPVPSLDGNLQRMVVVL
ncbi:MAG: hypothetical protein IPP27_18780 [Bacteroidetes bacterium]|nr:hypothetical protein [Bacteroidota bacterium]